MHISRLAFHFARIVAVVVIVATLDVPSAHSQTIDTLDTTYKDWMAKNGVSQGVLAVTYERRLVFTRGYGGTTPEAAVLLASLSKAITGTCIGTLVDAGELSFNMRVGEVLAEFFKRKGNPADPRVKDLTVAQLLTHRSGYGTIIDPAVSGTLGYLMYKHVDTAAIEHVLERAFRVVIPHAPGVAYNYSNMSYLMLGAIIEAVTGQPYEQYCRDVVLRPLGIEDVNLDPTWKIMSSYGGWRMTGPQYLRFLEAFAPDSKVLGAKSQVFMADGEGKWVDDRKDVYYALGVRVRPLQNGGYDVWHSGSWQYDFRNSINGVLQENTGTYAVRFVSGVSWFAQYRPKPDNAAVSELERAMGRAIGAVKTWPTEDLEATTEEN